MLTDAAIKKALAGRARPFRLAEGHGLAFVAPRAGALWWRLDYRFEGRHKTISLGTYPVVTLARAREKLLEIRRQLDQGLDPSVERKRSKVASDDVTFADAMRAWLAVRRPRLARSSMTRDTLLLELHVIPRIGRRRIASLRAPDVLELLHRISTDSVGNAHRLRQLIGSICRYAIGKRWTTEDPTRDLRGQLEPHRPQAFATMTEPAAVGALLRAIDGYEGSPVVREALRLAPYVFLRPGELRQAQWTDLDFERAIWMVPEDRVKTRRTLLVPMAPQVITRLQALRRASTGPYLFPSARTDHRPLSNMALNAALRAMGYGPDRLVVHGFRAMARTMMDEQLHERTELIELQLNHTVPGALGATYNRSSYLHERAAMMRRWADYLDDLRRRNG